MNILDEANKIVNERTQEADRNYGPFSESMTRAAAIMSLLTKKEITPRDMYLAMVALKLSREAHAHKEDNLLDTVAYLGALNNYHEHDK